jgi:competence protein ComFC
MIKYPLSITHTCFVRNVDINKNLTMSLLKNILDIIFPKYCISCGKSGLDLCPKCLSSCPETDRESAKWIFPIYDYRYPPIKKAIWLLKYKNGKNFAKIFAEIMYIRIIEELSDLSVFNNFKEPILIPIPLSRKRANKRGYNQSILICNELIKLDKGIFSHNYKNFTLEKHILIKQKDKKHQALTENKKERLKNIIDSFSVVDSSKIKGKNIILIDDVITTGATLNEAKKTLKKYGARKIVAFTIAH